MKKLVILFALTMMSTQSAFAAFNFNDSVENDVKIISAKITNFDIRQDWLGFIDQGSIAINLTDKKINLTLMSQLPCDSNMVCAAVMTEYHQIQVELVSQYTDSCGATHYVGIKDNTPVDGMRETVHVVDYVLMICDIFVADATSVSYETFNPRTEETLISNFGADRLLVQPTFFQ